jgi:hypothetical protein
MIESAETKCVVLIPHQLGRPWLNAAVLSVDSQRETIICSDVRQRGPGAALMDVVVEHEYFPDARYIAVLDDDDLEMPGGIDRCVKALEEDAMAPFACGTWQEFSDDSPGYKITRGRRLTKDKLLAGKFGSVGLKVYRRSALDAVGWFDATLPVAYDFDVCRRLCGAFDADPVWEEYPIVKYRIHLGQLTKNRTKEHGLILNWIAKRPVWRIV